jgi:hypothetical protein
MKQADESAVYFLASDKTQWDNAFIEILGGGSGRYVLFVVNNFDVESANPVLIPTGVNIDLTICGDKEIQLDGSGSLLMIGSNQTVTLQDVKLVGGNDNSSSLVNVNGGEFIMKGSASISENANMYGDGGGVFISNGKFTMQGNASVHGNICVRGGGVFISNGKFTMQGNAKVSGNTGGNSGGGVYITTVSGLPSEFIMQDSSSVSDNTTSGSNGGGVYITTVSGLPSEFIMQDNASVSGNTAQSSGGVYVYMGTFTMNGSTSVSGNTAFSGGGYGGGVAVDNNGTFTMNGSANVSGNTAFSGGGVLVNMGTFIMNGSTSVSGNTAITSGGGVSMNSGTFTMNGSASVSGNTAITSGGGVSMFGGIFHIQSGTVTGNKPYNGFAPNKAGTSTTGTGVSLHVLPFSSPSALWGTGVGTDLDVDGTTDGSGGYLIDDTITGNGVMP